MSCVGGWVIWVSMLAMMLVGITSAQQPSTSSSDSAPPHSGIAAGPSGPRAGSAPPPATKAINPVVLEPAHPQIRTFTGIISDSFCTRHHYMLSGATSAECTRYCMAHRGNYVLIVGDKIYILQTDPGHILDDLAGQSAQVTGALFTDDVIEIKSVGPVRTQKNRAP